VAVECRAEAGQWLQELVFLMGQVGQQGNLAAFRKLLGVLAARVNDLDPVTRRLRRGRQDQRPRPPLGGTPPAGGSWTLRIPPAGESHARRLEASGRPGCFRVPGRLCKALPAVHPVGAGSALTSTASAMSRQIARASA
jgi:hypothetical protein